MWILRKRQFDSASGGFEKIDGTPSSSGFPANGFRSVKAIDYTGTKAPWRKASRDQRQFGQQRLQHSQRLGLKGRPLRPTWAFPRGEMHDRSDEALLHGPNWAHGSRMGCVRKSDTPGRQVPRDVLWRVPLASNATHRSGHRLGTKYGACRPSEKNVARVNRPIRRNRSSLVDDDERRQFISAPTPPR